MLIAKMRWSSLLMSLLVWSSLSLEAHGKPVDVEDVLVNIVTKALGGTSNEKTEAISIILELLAEIDLPTLCQSITAESASSHITRLDDIIARAAPVHDVTPPSIVLPERHDDNGSEANAPEKSHFTNSQTFSTKVHPFSDRLDYFAKLRPLPQEYPDYNFLLPGNSNYDFLDVNDNLVSGISSAAATSSAESDVTKESSSPGSMVTKDASAMFFPEGLLAFNSLANADSGEQDRVVVKGSQSLKPSTKLLAENLKLEDFNGADYPTTKGLDLSSETTSGSALTSSRKFWSEKGDSDKLDNSTIPSEFNVTNSTIPSEFNVTNSTIPSEFNVTMPTTENGDASEDSDIYMFNVTEMVSSENEDDSNRTSTLSNITTESSPASSSFSTILTTTSPEATIIMTTSTATESPETEADSSVQSESILVTQKLQNSLYPGNSSNNNITFSAALFHSLTVRLEANGRDAGDENETENNDLHNTKSLEMFTSVMPTANSTIAFFNQSLDDLNSTSASEDDVILRLGDLLVGSNYSETTDTNNSVTISSQSIPLSSENETSQMETLIKNQMKNLTTSDEASFETVATEDTVLSEVNTTSNVSSPKPGINVTHVPDPEESGEDVLENTTKVDGLTPMLKSEKSIKDIPYSKATESTTQSFSLKPTSAPNQVESDTTPTEDSRVPEPQTYTNYKAEIQWWKPHSHIPTAYKQKEDSRHEKKTAVDDVLPLEPFREWSGREIEYKWPNMFAKSAAAAFSDHKGEFYGEKGPNYNTYSVDFGQEHDHKPHWENYLDAKHTPDSLSSQKKDDLTEKVVSTDTKFNDKLDATDSKTGPHKLSADKFQPFSYHYSPGHWSPFNPQLIVPNLGTLWGMNPDPRMPSYDRDYLRYKKFNDQYSAPDGPRYLIPKVQKAKAVEVESPKRRSDQKKISHKMEAGHPKVSDSALNHLGVQQRTIWSETVPPQSHSRVNPKGYACPGLFGYFGDSMDCRSFFICSWGVPYRFYCPSGTLWNPAQSVCDWSREVECNPQ